MRGNIQGVKERVSKMLLLEYRLESFTPLSHGDIMSSILDRVANV